MKTKHLTTISVAIGFASLFIGSFFPIRGECETLWYSGDFDGKSGYANRIDYLGLSVLPQAKVFERFVITNSEGWDIEALWSGNWNQGQTNGLLDWSLRTGMASGVGGSVLYSATNAPFAMVPTGRGYLPNPPDPGDVPIPEYRFLVSGLHVHLNPGEYWINVTPFEMDLQISTTSGSNSINQPAESGHTALWWWSNGFQDYDPIEFHFSMGVAGTVSKPTLQILSIPPQVNLAWPTNYSNYILETRMGSTTGDPWETVTNTPIIVGNMLTVTNRIDGQARLFRLRKR